MLKELEPPITNTLSTKSGLESPNFQPLTAAPDDIPFIVESPTTLDFHGYGSIEIKEYYEPEDFAKLTGRSIKSSITLIAAARKNDSSIVGVRIEKSYHYRKEGFIKIMLYERDKIRQASQLAIIGHYIFFKDSKEQSQAIPIKNKYQIEILDALTAAGENGKIIDDLVTPYMNDGINGPNAIGRFRHDLYHLTKEGCIIDNLTPLSDSHRHIKAVYVFKGIKPRQAEVPINPVLAKEIASYPNSSNKEEASLQSLQSEILDKTVAYLLSELALGHTEAISRNVRVIMGKYLPPKKTLPEIFGIGPLQVIDDIKIKNDIIKHADNKLKTYWDQEPTVTKDISEADIQMLPAIRNLRRNGQTIETIIDDIKRGLR